MNWNKDLKIFKDKVIAVDFDGTVVKDKFPEIGEPDMELVDWLKKCKKNGCELILWTCRSENIITNNGKGAVFNAVEFCKTLGLEFDAVNENLKRVQEKWNNDTRKVLADYYLDDKSLNYE